MVPKYTTLSIIKMRVHMPLSIKQTHTIVFPKMYLGLIEWYFIYPQHIQHVRLHLSQNGKQEVFYKKLVDKLQFLLQAEYYNHCSLKLIIILLRTPEIPGTDLFNTTDSL